MMLRTAPAGSVLARALMMALIGVSAILGLVGMHAFHPESHLVSHPSPPVASASHAHTDHDTDPTAHSGLAHGDLQPGAAHGSAGCGDCGMDGGHVMVMVLCLLTLLVSAGVTLWPPARPLLRPALPLRLLYRQLGGRWPTTPASSRPPSLQLLSILRI